MSVIGHVAQALAAAPTETNFLRWPRACTGWRRQRDRCTLAGLPESSREAALCLLDSIGPTALGRLLEEGARRGFSLEPTHSYHPSHNRKARPCILIDEAHAGWVKILDLVDGRFKVVGNFNVTPRRREAPDA